MAALLALVPGCTAPDASANRALELPAPVLELLRPDTARVESLHPGVLYRYLWSPRGPWAVHLVQARLPGRCELAFDVLRAEARERGEGGHERVSAMVARAPAPVLAAVNADFFTPEGTAVGAEVVDGRVRSAVARPTFAWRPGAEPWLGTPTVASGRLGLGWPLSRLEGDGVTEAVGGFPDLLDGGRRVGDLEVGARPSFAAARHPRSAIGYDTGTGTVWIVVVDGRQLPHSAGMTLPELAALFEALGTDEAINLDGGGSSALVVRGAPANRPSDATGERAVVNALALVHDRSGCRP